MSPQDKIVPSSRIHLDSYFPHFFWFKSGYGHSTLLTPPRNVLSPCSALDKPMWGLDYRPQTHDYKLSHQNNNLRSNKSFSLAFTVL